METLVILLFVPPPRCSVQVFTNRGMLSMCTTHRREGTVHGEQWDACSNEETEAQRGSVTSELDSELFVCYMKFWQDIEKIPNHSGPLLKCNHFHHFAIFFLVFLS